MLLFLSKVHFEQTALVVLRSVFRIFEHRFQKYVVPLSRLKIDESMFHEINNFVVSFMIPNITISHDMISNPGI